MLAVLILLVRRNVPESPRWLFIHGREEEAERITAEIEQQVEKDTGRSLPDVPDSDEMTVRQRRTIPLALTIRSVVTLYPKRTVLGLGLFVGQAFLYNSVSFGLGTLLETFFHISSSNEPYFLVYFAVGNLLGPLLLSQLFDTVGRKVMITGTYVLSGILLAVIALLFVGHHFNSTTFIIALGVTFFFASAGASGAYLTVSEVFPMETRALCISVFYAIGTGLGGIIGPARLQRPDQLGKIQPRRDRVHDRCRGDGHRRARRAVLRDQRREPDPREHRQAAHRRGQTRRQLKRLGWSRRPVDGAGRRLNATPRGVPTR